MIRPLIRGLVDGALSTLGVVIGASSAQDAIIIISAGFSGAIANGFSNILAAFSAERTHGYLEMRKIENAMISQLKGTVVESEMQRKVMRRGTVDGFFTLVGGIIPIIPFLFLDIFSAVVTAIAMVVLLTASLGIYTGRYSKENMLVVGTKMGVFALITAGVCIAVERML